jgi:hypothetical protein
MKRSALLFVAPAMVAACGGTSVAQKAPETRQAAVTVQTTMPPQYLGEWTNRPELCGFEGDDLEQRLIVRQRSVGYFESMGTVREVRVTARGVSIAYDADPDADTIPPETLRLSDDGLRIFVSDDVSDRGYERCPADRV